MAFNMRKSPMNDLAFREAVATVINKELLAETVLAGAVIPGYTVVHPELAFWNNRDANKPGFGLDEGDRADAAIQILKDAGYTWDSEPVVNRDGDGNFQDITPGDGIRTPDGNLIPELTMLAPTPGYDPFRSTFGIFVEQWANNLGIPLVNVPTEFNAIIAATFPPQTPESALSWDMYMLGWGGGDPSLPGTSQVAFFHSREDAVAGGGFNTPGYNSAAFDAAADAFEASTTLDDAQRYTFEMERILQEELPYVVLFRTPIIEAFGTNVAFPVETIMGGMQGFPNAWPNAVEIVE
jgi:ABC-type transport system substrate-binding protein